MKTSCVLAGLAVRQLSYPLWIIFVRTFYVLLGPKMATPTSVVLETLYTGCVDCSVSKFTALCSK